MKIKIFKNKMIWNQIYIFLKTNINKKIKNNNQIGNKVNTKIIIMKILLMNTHNNKYNKINNL